MAVGPKVLRDKTFSAWEEVLSEIIVDDALGADRMEEGGSHAAEGLQLARYLMYTQVYFHPVRRSYDMLLKEFLSKWLARTFPTDLGAFLAVTDNEVLAAIRSAAADKEKPGHEPARRFCERGHYRLLYAWNARDARSRPDIVEVIYQEAAKEFGEANLRVEHYPAKDATVDFPTRLTDGRVASAASVSDVFGRVPPAKFEFVFVAPEFVKTANKWLARKLESLLPVEGGVDSGSLGA